MEIALQFFRPLQLSILTTANKYDYHTGKARFRLYGDSNLEKRLGLEDSNAQTTQRHLLFAPSWIPPSQNAI